MPPISSPYGYGQNWLSSRDFKMNENGVYYQEYTFKGSRNADQNLPSHWYRPSNNHQGSLSLSNQAYNSQQLLNMPRSGVPHTPINAQASNYHTSNFLMHGIGNPEQGGYSSQNSYYQIRTYNNPMGTYYNLQGPGLGNSFNDKYTQETLPGTYNRVPSSYQSIYQGQVPNPGYQAGLASNPNPTAHQEYMAEIKKPSTISQLTYQGQRPTTVPAYTGGVAPNPLMANTPQIENVAMSSDHLPEQAFISEEKTEKSNTGNPLYSTLRNFDDEKSEADDMKGTKSLPKGLTKQSKNVLFKEEQTLLNKMRQDLGNSQEDTLASNLITSNANTPKLEKNINSRIISILKTAVKDQSPGIQKVELTDEESSKDTSLPDEVRFENTNSKNLLTEKQLTAADQLSYNKDVYKATTQQPISDFPQEPPREKESLEDEQQQMHIPVNDEQIESNKQDSYGWQKFHTQTSIVEPHDEQASAVGTTAEGNGDVQTVEVTVGDQKKNDKRQTSVTPRGEDTTTPCPPGPQGCGEAIDLSHDTDVNSFVTSEIALAV